MAEFTGKVTSWRILGYQSEKAMNVAGQLTPALYALQNLYKCRDEKGLQNIINSARYFLDLAEKELEGDQNES